MKPIFKYIFLTVIFHIVIDFSGAFSPYIEQWTGMPIIWYSVYLLYTPIFAYLFYIKKWKEKNVFIFMIIFTYILEITLFGNVMLYAFPGMLIMIPVAIGIYSGITFVPKWIVEGEILKNKKKVIAAVSMCIIVAIIRLIENL